MSDAFGRVVSNPWAFCQRTGSARLQPGLEREPAPLYARDIAGAESEPGAGRVEFGEQRRRPALHRRSRIGAIVDSVPGAQEGSTVVRGKEEEAVSPDHGILGRAAQRLDPDCGLREPAAHDEVEGHCLARCGIVTLARRPGDQ